MAHILVVEDDEDLLFLYATMFTRQGHTSLKARRVVQAIQFLDSAPVELVVLDMNMPDAPGIRVVEHMRQNERLAHIPVVVISANDQWRKLCEEMGVEQFLTKPVSMQQIVTLLDDVLG